jgi:hypothetical protein
MPVPISEWGGGEWLTFAVIALTLLISIGIFWLAADAQWCAPRRAARRRFAELNDPVDFHFLGPPRTQRQIEYAKQDEREHLFYEIVLKPETFTVIELRIHPRTRFLTTAFLFGCEYDEADENARDEIPCPVQIIDVYGQGIIQKDAMPNFTSGHILNKRNQYRWNQEIRWNALTTLIIGILMRTARVGTYKFFMYLIGDEAEHKKELTIRVEETNEVNLRCVNDKHERHNVEATFLGKPFCNDQAFVGVGRAATGTCRVAAATDEGLVRFQKSHAAEATDQPVTQLVRNGQRRLIRHINRLIGATLAYWLRR